MTTPSPLTHYWHAPTRSLTPLCGAHMMSRKHTDPAKVTCPVCRAAMAQLDSYEVIEHRTAEERALFCRDWKAYAARAAMQALLRERLP